jgi:hypothetical protein
MAAKTADTKLTARALEKSPNEKITNNLAINKYNGAPGGWLICKVAAEAISSPLSQKLTV